MHSKAFLLTAAAVALASPATAQDQTTTTENPAATPTTPAGDPATATQTPPTTTASEGPPAAVTTQPATVTAATAADLKAGVEVYDQSGALVGKVDSVSENGAVVNTGNARAEIPVTSFGKNDKGLVVSITKTEIDAKAKAEAPDAAAEKPKT